MNVACLLCAVPVTRLDGDRFLHPPAEDCLVQLTDAWGVAIEDVETPEYVVPEPRGDSFEINLFPYVDVVLDEIFVAHGVPRLGGASTGRGWSSFSRWQQCNYAWKKHYLDKHQPTLRVEAPGRAVGSLAHAFLAVYYMNMLDESYPLVPEALYERAKLRANPQFVEEGWRVFTAYRLFYLYEKIQPLAIEYNLRDPRTNESCRYDLIAFFPESVDGRPAGTYNVEHKCLHADEKIQDYATGQLYTVSALHAKGIAPVVLAYDERKRRMVKTQAEVPRPTTVRDTYEVTLASGQRLRTSDNHPFLTARGWVPAAELTTNDWVASAPSTAGYDGPSAFTDAQVEFIGLMLGDGCMTNGKFTKTEPAVMQRFMRAAEAIGDRPTLHHSKDRAPYAQISQAKTGAGRELLEWLGLWGHLAATKFVPDALLAIPDRQVALLLGALWNTDGCIDVFEEHSRARPDDSQLKVRAAYVSRSKALCDGVQALLRRAGFPATVTESSVEYGGERRDVWTTKVITRGGKRRFLESIILGWIPFVRYAVTDAHAAIKPGDDALIPSTYVLDSVPDDELTGTLRCQLNNTRAVTRQTLALHDGKKPSNGLKRVLNSELTWSRVACVLISGRAMMYDITVPGVHTFVTNGIITHNTAQRFDADTLDGWVNDGEIIGEVALWKRLGLDHRFGKLQGVLVNILGKQKEPQFHRTFVAPESWQIEGHLDDLRRHEGRIKLAMATNDFPRSRANCVGRYGRCEWWDNCASGDP